METKLLLFTRVAMATLAILGIQACTKDVPYKYTNKDQVLAKGLVDSQADYLYVVSYQDVSRNSELARPYWQGSEKLVHLRFTEKTLQVVESDADERFRGNQRNTKPVLEIPIEHLDYRCATDSYGECTNREEANNDITWEQKGRFKPDFSNVQITELNILPVELDTVFGTSCYSPAGSKVVGYELSGDALDFQIERIFSVTGACLNSLETLSDATVSVVYHYSLKKLATLASADYQAVDYPAADEQAFGFFTTEEIKLDVDNRAADGLKTVYLNRWNPKRGEINYYLSQEFTKAENKAIRDASFQAFARLNKGLEASGTDLRLVLHDWSGQKPGDIKNNMIVAVEDPIAAGLLGYGPSVTNPKTGEILSARTIMYPGVMKKYIRRTYEDLRLERQKKTLADNSAALAAKQQPAADVAASNNKQSSLIGSSHRLSHSLNRSSANSLAHSALAEETLRKIERTLRDTTKNVAPAERLKDRLEAMSQHCAYPADLFNFDGIIGESVEDAFKGELKPWDEMTVAEKQQVIDTLLPLVWIPTLVHEMGHNLGLRHNFKGSQDAANFYTTDELAAMGVHHPIPYSTMMEYPYSDTNSLPTLGKYDIAALRFAYTREVELASGAMQKVQGSLGAMEKASPPADGALKLKPYGFCTDEHVGANADCKRFDEGTTYTEIARHFIEKFYKEGYKRNNFRDGRRSFSLADDGAYVARVNGVFTNLRLLFETYERIKNDFQISPDDPAWQAYPFLKDIRQATDLAASFFVDVLRTPDALCLVADAANPEKILGPVALQALSTRAISCFDKENVQLKPGFAIVAQGGKLFQSKKDPNSGNPYFDQIDVRGIWGDKLLAFRQLTGRILGSPSFDRYTENLLSYPGVAANLHATLESIILDSAVGDVEFESQSGEKATIQVAYDFFATHLIPAPLNSGVTTALHLNEQGETLFVEQLLRDLQREVPSRLHQTDATAFLERYEVRTRIPQDGRPVKDFTAIDVGTRRYLALPQNAIALKVINSLKAVRVLTAVKAETLAPILEKLQARVKVQPSASAQEKAVYALGAETVEAFINGQFKDASYYERVLGLLPVVVE